jgi:STE24 endopeptidase
LLFGLLSAISALYQAFIDNIMFMILGAWLVLVFITLLIAYLNTKVFVKIFNKLTPLPDGELKDRIIELSHQVGFHIKGISIMDASKRSTKLNAFFSGMGKTREVVLFDTLKDKLIDDEILAVLAHEFGHMVHKDIPKMMIQRSLVYLVFAVMLAGILSIDELFIHFNMPIGFLGFGIILLTILYEPIGLRMSMITNYLSRKAEYKADAFSCKLMDKKYMLSALRKLVKENFSNLNPHPLYEKIHYSHPKIADRLSAIEKQS